MKPLPPSSDKEFWAESEINNFAISKPKPEEKHFLVWSGGHAVCVSCPYPHTIPLDKRKFDLVKGCIVRRDDSVLK
jgi:hypothetical protein